MADGDRLSIKEFSRLTGIKQTTLRYYDELGLLSPTMRGENHYRYYSPQQLITINAIQLLHDLDMPIKRICELQASRTPEDIYDVLSNKEQELVSELLRLERSYSVIRTLRKLIADGLAATEGQFSVVPMEEMQIIIGAPNVFGQSEHFYHAFLAFCAQAKNRGIDMRFSVGGMFTSFSTFQAAPSHPSHFFSLDPHGADRKPVGQYLVGYARGYYGEVGTLPEEMEAYIKEHALTPQGPLYIIYLHDEICIRDRHKYLFQVSVRIS